MRLADAALAQGADQPRLADAGLADQQHAPPLAVAGLRQRWRNISSSASRPTSGVSPRCTRASKRSPTGSPGRATGATGVGDALERRRPDPRGRTGSRPAAAWRRSITTCRAAPSGARGDVGRLADDRLLVARRARRRHRPPPPGRYRCRCASAARRAAPRRSPGAGAQRQRRHAPRGRRRPRGPRIAEIDQHAVAHVAARRGRPPRSTAAATAAWKARDSSRMSSGSSRSDSGVEPTRSTNITVIWRRSAADWARCIGWRAGGAGSARACRRAAIARTRRLRSPSDRPSSRRSASVRSTSTSQSTECSAKRSAWLPRPDAGQPCLEV